MKSIESTRRKIGEKLRELRLQAGHSNYEYWGYQIGISKRVIWKAENAKGINLDSLLKILQALKVSPEEFFKGIK